MRSEASALIDLIAIVAFIMTLILLAGCERSEKPLDTTPTANTRQLDAEDMDSAQHVVDAYNSARNAGDVGRVTGLVIKRIANEGEDAVKKGWADVKSTRFEVLSVEDRGGNKKWVIGKYNIERSDGTVRDYDYWVFPVYKENGKWRVDPDGAEQATDEWMRENHKGDYANN